MDVFEQGLFYENDNQYANFILTGKYRAERRRRQEEEIRARIAAEQAAAEAADYAKLQEELKKEEEIRAKIAKEKAEADAKAKAEAQLKAKLKAEAEAEALVKVRKELEEQNKLSEDKTSVVSVEDKNKKLLIYGGVGVGALLLIVLLVRKRNG